MQVMMGLNTAAAFTHHSTSSQRNDRSTSSTVSVNRDELRHRPRVRSFGSSGSSGNGGRSGDRSSITNQEVQYYSSSTRQQFSMGHMEQSGPRHGQVTASTSLGSAAASAAARAKHDGKVTIVSVRRSASIEQLRAKVIRVSPVSYNRCVATSAHALFLVAMQGDVM